MAIVNYTATAGQTNFNITFGYINEAHLSVQVEGTTIDRADWSLLDATTMVLDGAVVVAEEDLVTILRTTPIDEPLVMFTAPASMRPRELQISQLQALYALEEQALQTTEGLRKNLSGNSWYGEGLPLKSLAAPEDDTDAATMIWVLGQLASTGVLPEPSTDDIGKGIRIRGGGGGATYAISPVNGARQVFEVIQDPSGVPGSQLGHDVHKGGSGVNFDFSQSADMRVPLVLKSETGTPEAGSVAVDANTFDLIVPRGSWRIKVEGTARNLTNGTSFNFNFFCAALTDDTGTTVYDAGPHVTLGVGAGANSATPDGFPKFPYQSSVPYSLEIRETFLATTKINLRASCAQSAADVIMDVPFRVTVDEIPF